MFFINFTKITVGDNTSHKDYTNGTQRSVNLFKQLLNMTLQYFCVLSGTSLLLVVALTVNGALLTRCLVWSNLDDNGSMVLWCRWAVWNSGSPLDEDKSVKAEVFPSAGVQWGTQKWKESKKKKKRKTKMKEQQQVNHPASMERLLPWLKGDLTIIVIIHFI